jgi:hypothetical protein
VNGQVVVAVDPLFLQQSGRHSGARQFGEDLVYGLPGPNGGGKVEVRFSELPVERWHNLSSEEKRGLGVTSAPCVSVVRAGREIDRGWFFMGSKRRENYDDWWRCEISFDPSLDELFGLTHAKQTISPTDELERVLAPDLEPIARALNNRVRHRFEVLKVTSPLGAAERQAARAEAALPRLPRRREIIPKELQRLLADHTIGSEGQENPYQIVVTDLPTTAAFDILIHRGQLVLLLNGGHPLYRDLYGPLAASDSEKDKGVAKQVALALLAAARAEATTRRTGRSEVRRFRQAWADVVATFFNA